MATEERQKKKINRDIGLRLRDMREAFGYTQYEFSKVLHVSEDHYRKIESGTSGMTLDKYQILYDKFHMEPSYLIAGKSNQDVELEYYLQQCGQTERNKILGRFLDYLAAYVVK